MGHSFPSYFNQETLVLILFGRGVAMMRATDMKPIMTVYPGYQALPKGLKRMLVESESFFFEEETTFFRRERKASASTEVAELQVAGTQTLSQSWDTGSDVELVSE